MSLIHQNMGCVHASSSLQESSTDVHPPPPTRVECLVCFDDADMVLYPCGHYCVCRACALSLSSNDRQRLGDTNYMRINLKKCHALFCPLCRRLSVPIKIFQNDTYHTL